jgi:hypothetical protein
MGGCLRALSRFSPKKANLTTDDTDDMDLQIQKWFYSTF